MNFSYSLIEPLVCKFPILFFCGFVLKVLYLIFTKRNLAYGKIAEIT